VGTWPSELGKMMPVAVRGEERTCGALGKKNSARGGECTWEGGGRAVRQKNGQPVTSIYLKTK